MDVDLLLDRVYIEVRFPRRLAFIDHVGHIADHFEDGFDEATLTSTEMRLSTEDGNELTLEPERIVADHQSGDWMWALGQVTRALAVVSKIVGVEELSYVGARQKFIQPVGGVSDATALFRSTFFNYRDWPLAAFGTDPIEAQARIAFRLSDGTCKVTATAISRASQEESSTVEEPPGALLVDVDRANDTGTTSIWAAEELAEGLLTDGRARAIDFVSGLKGVAPGPMGKGREHGSN